MYYVYLLSDGANKKLYTGLTNDLRHTLEGHKRGEEDQYAARHQINRLVYYEYTMDVRRAVNRRRQLRYATPRENSERITETNPGWRDLSLDWQ